MDFFFHYKSLLTPSVEEEATVWGASTGAAEKVRTGVLPARRDHEATKAETRVTAEVISLFLFL